MGDVRKLQEEICDDFKNKKVKFLSKKSKIRFQCQHSGQCCHHNEVMLSPFDIMEMSRFLEIPSLVFFTDYVSIHIGSNSHLPIAMLRQIQKGECVFLKDRKCSIHPAKPKIFRAFPLAALTVLDKKTGKIKSGYMQPRQIDCPGTRANHTVTFEQFAKQADLRRYDEGSRPFLEGINTLIENYRTEDLAEWDYSFIIPFLYFPDSTLKQANNAKPFDSAQWAKVGMESVMEYMNARNLKK